MSKVTNERLTRELANCRSALKPFAAALKRVDRGGPDEAMFIGAGLSLGDLRSARAALEAVSSIHETEPVGWEAEVLAAMVKHLEPEMLAALTYEHGPYQITKVRSRIMNFASALRLAHPAPISKGVTVKALEAIERIIRTNVVGNEQPNRMLIDGEWHTGPVVDMTVRLLQGLQKIAAQALELCHTAGEIEAGGEGEPTRYFIEHDGFVGTVIGRYTRLDGKHGVVMQQDGTNIVHVYGSKWLKPAGPPVSSSSQPGGGE